MPGEPDTAVAEFDCCQYEVRQVIDEEAFVALAAERVAQARVGERPTA
jgi:hypothetical protein